MLMLPKLQNDSMDLLMHLHVDHTLILSRNTFERFYEQTDEESMLRYFLYWALANTVDRGGISFPELWKMADDGFISWSLVYDTSRDIASDIHHRWYVVSRV